MRGRSDLLGRGGDASASDGVKEDCDEVGDPVVVTQSVGGVRRRRWQIEK